MFKNFTQYPFLTHVLTVLLTPAYVFPTPFFINSLIISGPHFYFNTHHITYPQAPHIKSMTYLSYFSIQQIFIP